MNIFNEFLKNFNYDVRITGDARWIDQKCTYDVVSIIADCIVEYVDSKENNDIEFSIGDIWRSNYANNNVVAIFSKPDTQKKQARNEYDKYFGQPIKLFAYSKLLNSRKEGNKYIYSINNKKLLEKIALRPLNALDFLYDYIVKVLNDSGLSDPFDSFFKIQTKNTYMNVRQEFTDFTIKNTKINTSIECGRIFTKIINPLAFKLKKHGTEKGRISKNIITLHDLSYNKPNWSDVLSGKDKTITRKEFKSTNESLRHQAYAKYTIDKAKRSVKKHNQIINQGKSEVLQKTETVLATQAHHIFPQSEYPSIADYLENLIMLTPNQHLAMAHPNNKTMYIDKDFQYICLIAKCTSIYQDYVSTSKDKFYNFEDYKFVLDVGLKTNSFQELSNHDFAGIIHKIDYFYNNNLNNNKYLDLIKPNKLT